MTSTAIRIAMLGAPVIAVQGEPLAINRLQIRSCLFRLAAQSEPLPRDLLAHLFWPRAADAQARRHLTQLLSHVRRALPTPALLLQSSTHVQLDWECVWCDVVVFKRHAVQPDRLSGATLQEAIALYRGSFLDGITTPGLPDYELWLQSEQVWLERRYLDLLERRTLECMASEAFSPAIELIQRHLAIDDLSENAHARLILCYAASGDRAAALRQYERCVALLQQELNAPPATETVAIYQAVRGGATWPELRPLVLPDCTKQLDRTLTVVTGQSAPPPMLDNLPHEPLPIVGRSAELAALASLLGDAQNRLTTLVGVGGMGKTRLALAAAWEQRRLHTFTDGVYFVALASLTDPAQIVPAILQALGLSAGAGAAERRGPLEQMLDFLREKQLLLLLDNFEHLLGGVDVVTDIVRTAPGVHLLVTSRKALGVHGEQLFPLGELPYPAAETSFKHLTSTHSDADPASYPAIQLFVQCARRSTPSFELNEENQTDVVRICQLVGGMPLALELAAPWIRMLSTAEIGVEIARGLDFLDAEIQDMPARHHSIHALLATIWQQLPAVEQAAFARLAVFQGGFTRHAAEEIAGVSLRILRSLAGGFLIHYDGTKGRYSSHALLHAYGAEQLAALPTVLRQMRQRHSQYYGALLARLAPQLRGPRQQNAFAELAVEQANLQLAWEWSLAQEDLNRLEETTAGLSDLYERIGNQIDGINVFGAFVHTLEQARQDDEDDQARGPRARLLAQGLAWLANFTLMAGSVKEAEAQLRRSLTLLGEAESLGLDCRRARALAMLHHGHLERPRDLVAAARAYEASGALYEEIALPWESAYALSWLGETQHLMGKEEAAIELLTQARRTFEALGDQRNVARVSATIADCYLLDRAELDVAAETAAASLRLWRASGDQLGIANSALILAYAHLWLNRPDRAEPLIDEALTIYRHHGHRYGECRAYSMMMVAANYRTDIERKETSAQQGLRLARELDDAKLISDFSRGLANVYMARGEYERAYPLHVQAIAVQEEAGVKAIMPWLHIVRGYSSWKTGRLDEARRHLAYALRAGAENADVYTAVFAVLFVAQILQAQGNLERAMELYALAQRDYIWQGSLSGDAIMIEPLLTLEASLPPAVAAAARKRGVARDLFATVAQLATEIQDSSWHWGTMSQSRTSDSSLRSA